MRILRILTRGGISYRSDRALRCEQVSPSFGKSDLE